MSPYRALKLLETLPKTAVSFSFSTLFTKDLPSNIMPTWSLKTLNFSEELTNYYNLYQLFLFHFREEGG